jgi:hypothetical protein
MTDLTRYAMPQTVRAIFAHYSTRASNYPRPHFGGSTIGAECSRQLWYSFRWASHQQHDGRTLRLFETGNREEKRLIGELRAIGITVWDRDPDNPSAQISFSEYGGHFKTSLDAIAEGFVESSVPHVLEFKTMNDSNFHKLQNDGVRKSKPVHFAQVQIGMHMSGLDRAFYFAVNKNSDDIYGERIRADKQEGKRLLEKARSIIFAATPPARISEDPSFYICRFCMHRAICHQDVVPEVSCRTCAHVTPEHDGTFSCARFNKTLSIEEQRAGCNDHLFIPQMMPWAVADACDYFVKYENGILNCNNSRELK